MGPVGAIGLGLMGHAIAGRLLAGGRCVVGYDVRDDCRRRLAEIGCEPCGSVYDVFTAARETC